MKVCLINNLYKPYNRGGAESYLEKLENGFEKRGDNVFVISSRPLFSRESEFKKNYYLNSFYYFLRKLPFFLRLFWHIFNIFNILNYFQIRAILKKEKPGLIITNNLLGIGFLVPRLISDLGIKHIHVLHDIQLLHPSGLMFIGREKMLDTFFASIYQRINAYLFSTVTYLVSPSDWLLKLHKKKGFFLNARMKKIFNPIELDENYDKPKKRRKKDFLYVGQIENHKGIDFLFTTMDKVRKKYDFNFRIIGDGSVLKEAKTKYPDFNFLGRKKRDDVLIEMKRAGLMIISSTCYENSPSVIYEAASMGLNFIYPDFGGASEIGRYFSGVPFDSDNQKTLEGLVVKYLEKGFEKRDNEKKVLALSTSKYIENILNIV